MTGNLSTGTAFIVICVGIAEIMLLGLLVTLGRWCAQERRELGRNRATQRAEAARLARIDQELTSRHRRLYRDREILADDRKEFLDSTREHRTARLLGELAHNGPDKPELMMPPLTERVEIATGLPAQLHLVTEPVAQPES